MTGYPRIVHSIISCTPVSVSMLPDSSTSIIVKSHKDYGFVNWMLAIAGYKRIQKLSDRYSSWQLGTEVINVQRNGGN